MTVQEMINRIDLVTDTQRAKIVVDPVRTFEYQIAEKEARSFKAGGYEGAIPQTVSSWMEASGLDKVNATDATLQMADSFNNALNNIRKIRLVAKYKLLNSSIYEDQVDTYIQ